MAKSQKLGRTHKDARGREVAEVRAARAHEQTLCIPETAAMVAGEQQDAVRRLAHLCNNPAPSDISARMERMVALQKSIATGTYLISAAEIADKLIGHMLMNRPARP